MAKKPTAAAPSPLTLERRRRAALRGWVVGWGGLFVDDEGYLTLREDARVFPSWLRAFWASWLLPFFPLPFFWGWPRRTRP